MDTWTVVIIKRKISLTDCVFYRNLQLHLGSTHVNVLPICLQAVRNINKSPTNKQDSTLRTSQITCLTLQYSTRKFHSRVFMNISLVTCKQKLGDTCFLKPLTIPNIKMICWCKLFCKALSVYKVSVSKSFQLYDRSHSVHKVRTMFKIHCV